MAKILWAMKMGESDPLMLEDNFIVEGPIGQPITRLIQFTGTTPTLWEVSDALDFAAKGLTLIAGLIAGTPTTVFSKTFTITASAGAEVAQVDVTITTTLF